MREIYSATQCRAEQRHAMLRMAPLRQASQRFNYSLIFATRFGNARRRSVSLYIAPQRSAPHRNEFCIALHSARLRTARHGTAPYRNEFRVALRTAVLRAARQRPAPRRNDLFFACTFAPSGTATPRHALLCSAPLVTAPFRIATTFICRNAAPHFAPSGIAALVDSAHCSAMYCNDSMTSIARVSPNASIFDVATRRATLFRFAPQRSAPRRSVPLRTALLRHIPQRKVIYGN